MWENVSEKGFNLVITNRAAEQLRVNIVTGTGTLGGLTEAFMRKFDRGLYKGWGKLLRFKQTELAPGQALGEQLIVK